MADTILVSNFTERNAPEVKAPSGGPSEIKWGALD